MKKFLSVVLFGVFAFCMFGSVEKPAVAQPVPYGNFCCDTGGWHRCVLDYPAPIGMACFCRGQGYGHTCL